MKCKTNFGKRSNVCRILVELMKMNLLFLAFLVVILSCSRKGIVDHKKSTEVCTEDRANEICIEFLEKHRLLGFEPNFLLLDTLLTYKIQVLDKGENTLGGGGEFEISRQTCKILNVQLYQ